MRILHWYPNFLGGGGVANAVRELAAAQSRIGAEVAIMAASHRAPALYGAMALSADVGIMHWKPKWTIKLPQFLLRKIPQDVPAWLSRFKPDVVHVHGEFNPDNLWVPNLFGGPIVLSPQGAINPEVLNKNARSIKYLYFSIARKLLYRKILSFHACCPLEGAHIAELLPSIPFYCAPNGAAAPTLETCRENRISETASRDPTVKCLFVGRLSVYQKGLDILLRAFAEAVKYSNGPALSLTLIGPDWDGGMARLMQLAKQLGIDDRVFFAGTLPNEKIAAALKTFDIYIQLSRYEGFSLSIAEALLAGKPAILSRSTGTGSYREIGSLPHIRLVGLDPREATQGILEFAGRLSGVKQDAQLHREGLREFFSWERIARLHLETYEALAAANR